MSIRSNRVESTNFSEHPQSTEYKSRANGLPVCRIDITGKELCRFNRIVSKRQHFQPTLYSPVALYFLSLAKIDFRHVESTINADESCRFHPRNHESTSGNANRKC